MRCTHPVTQPHPLQPELTFTRRCSLCMACRIHRRQEITTRLLLEQRAHKSSIFCTLTYKNTPELNSLSKRDTQTFWKRLRFNSGLKIRYFLCGEYGPKTDRPHYHAILFGAECTPHTEELIHSSWGHGFISMSEMTNSRAAYVARYTVKKMTSPASFPDGREPEFGTMSKRPALGSGMAPLIAQTIIKANNKLKTSSGSGSGLSPDSTESAVALMHRGYIRLDQKIWPLDRWLRLKVLSEISEIDPELASMLSITDPEEHHRLSLKSQMQDIADTLSGRSWSTEIRALNHSIKANRSAL